MSLIVIFISRQGFLSRQIARISVHFTLGSFLLSDVPDNPEDDTQHGQDDQDNHNGKQSAVTLAASHSAFSASAAQS